MAFAGGFVIKWIYLLIGDEKRNSIIPITPHQPSTIVRKVIFPVKKKSLSQFLQANRPERKQDLIANLLKRHQSLFW